MEKFWQLRKFLIAWFIISLAGAALPYRHNLWTKNDLETGGIRKLNDEAFENEKRSLGFAKLVVISAGVIHASGIAVATFRVGFDKWFKDHQCCGVQKSICEDYASYTEIRDSMLAKGEITDKNYLLAQNEQTHLLALAAAMTDLQKAMIKLDESSMGLIKALIPNVEEKLQEEIQHLNKSRNYNIIDPVQTSKVRLTLLENLVRGAAYGVNVGMKYALQMEYEEILLVETALAGRLTLTAYRQANTRYKKITSTFNIARIGVLHAGAVALSVYGSVQDILYILKQIDDCNKIAKDMKTVLETMKNISAQNSHTYDDVLRLKRNVPQEYIKLKSHLTSPAFKTFLQHLVPQESRENSTILSNVGSSIDAFNSQIQGADHSETTRLVQNLTRAFKTMEKKIICQKEAVLAMNYAESLCMKGAKSNSELFSLTQDRLNGYRVECPELKTLNLDQFAYYIRNKMSKSNLSEQCLANNLILKSLICKNWLLETSDEANAIDVGIDLVELKVVVQSCNHGNVTSTISALICSSKDARNSLGEVKTSFNRFNSSQVESTYQQCALSSSSKTVICNLIHQYSLNEIINMYSNYPSHMVIETYNTCPQGVVPQSITNKICRQKNQGRSLSHSYFAMLIDDFGYDAIKNVYNSCSSKDDDEEDFDLKSMQRYFSEADALVDLSSRKDT